MPRKKTIRKKKKSRSRKKPEPKKLMRNTDDKIIGGVCSGIADYHIDCNDLSDKRCTYHNEKSIQHKHDRQL